MMTLTQASFKKEDQFILQNLDLHIDPGECVVLCGPSGSGKSTFFNVLNGLYPELYEGEVLGKWSVLGEELPAMDFASYIQKFGVVFQNPKTHFFTTDVTSELAFVMENFGYPAPEIRKQVTTVAKEYALTTLLEANVFSLSGGQKQQVSLAAATMLAPTLLLLDEPSSNLDFDALARLKHLLTQLKTQGVTILIAEHRLAYLVELADRFIVLENGQLKKNLTKEAMLELTPTELKALGLRQLVSQQMPILPSLEKEATITLTMENIRYRYRKQTHMALSIPSLILRNHEITGITGANGAGKSTFFTLLSGLTRTKKGRILLNGRQLKARERIDTCFLVMQDVNLQLFFETVRKELLAKAKVPERFEEICLRFGLTKLLERHPHTLSGGEKQRVVIASAILSGKKILLFDEPTSGLDYRNMMEVSALLKELAQEGLLILVISHDEEFLAQTCHRVLRFEQGEICSE